MDANSYIKKTSRELFANYIRFGSFPYLATITKEESIVESYIDGIYNTILIKDVAKREGITDISLLESIIKVIASIVGSLVYTKKSATQSIQPGEKFCLYLYESFM